MRKPATDPRSKAFREGLRLVAALHAKGDLDQTSADVLIRHLAATKISADITELVNDALRPGGVVRRHPEMFPGLF